MKIYTVVLSLLVLTGCASTNKDYQQYIDTSSKIQQSINAAESACLLVLAEAMKTADPIMRGAIAVQIDKCRKDPPKISPPKNWLGF